ncbi:MAG: Holliday junction branch migration protein RuvA, partial [Chloroflexi bacterium]|nr:Holliday junction branch migration protein RuvA [Chloroflexota bacterium]
MIASLDGIVAEIRGDSVVIVVGGVGLHVFAPTGTIVSLRGIGQRARLHTHLHFAQDAMALYGFATSEELRLFKLLLEVSGVGPKNGLRMLSTLSPKQLAGAIASGDEAALSRTPGIG